MLSFYFPSPHQLSDTRGREGGDDDWEGGELAAVKWHKGMTCAETPDFIVYHIK